MHCILYICIYFKKLHYNPALLDLIPVGLSGLTLILWTDFPASRDWLHTVIPNLL